MIKYIFLLMFACQPTFADIYEIDEGDAQFFLRLKELFSAESKDEIVGLVAYPLEVDFGDRQIVYQNSDDLLEDFTSVFSIHVFKAVEFEKPEELWKSWRGVCIGRGEIWNDQILPPNGRESCFRIIGVNPIIGDGVNLSDRSLENRITSRPEDGIEP